MSKFDVEKINQLIKISQLYYESGLNQTEISKQVHVHRTEISRLLKEARSLGIVKISIDTSFGASENLSNELQEYFSLKKAIVVPTEPHSLYANDLKSIGTYAGNYIQKQVFSNCIIGLSWGRTLATTFDNLSPIKHASGTTIVPMIGGPIGALDVNYQANNLVHTLASKVKNSASYTLDAPVMLSNPSLRDELLASPNSKDVINFWRQMDIAIFGIGSSEITNNLAWRGFYEGTGFRDVFSGPTVGDVLSQPFTVNGQVVKKFNKNLIATELEDLKKVPLRIAIAAGENKAEAILGALRLQLPSVLITTDKTAIAIKKLIH
ncbi:MULTISPECIES: sugar-binding transcriptional regulator [Lactiplantibacillus]|jgi:DNA-binding transcriptional regulator LsrR (DeoR family)|uniref:sugar-binding transcriptional regulator n=1 Tax=Lactiplantibacillus plantarum TaxID=1590 RepID=UPI00070934A1|nr:sugar-binding transcriptional regulator [Lactiplantibacillus plantarum]KRN39785.1 sorbitol operon transcriptional regulator [Lactiplantibacillus plantarum]MBS0940919.1 sugar-binding transcriptional regulator [Lactiplantibacillus plantarum]MCG0690876.1 sugar-binding transcriptional regulator [Lactiplantibacillus plantarum]MCG0942087.1 sugar-binding transcriptional regulator [Lactiplantibacillus plantarum]PCE78653.1 hypothetical protein CJP43_15445 [Lactiplantibacillus plantarum]